MWNTTQDDPTFERWATARLAAFELVGPLNKGGMGEVWHARHAESGADAAVKVLHGDRAADPRLVAAFGREVRLVAGLDHPGVITLYDYGRIPNGLEPLGLVPGSPYLVMELATGDSLDRAPLPMPYPVLREVLLRVLDALAHAHARGVLHLDVKPGNVLHTGRDGGYLLSDFGLARVFGDDSDLGLLGSGTPEFMPPEQAEARWRDQGPWSDLYAVGCMAWLLATGKHLFGEENRRATIRRHLDRVRPHLQDPPGTPPGFAAWVSSLIQWDGRDRPRDAASAAATLPGRALSVAQTWTLYSGEAAPAAFPPWRAPVPPRRPMRLLGVGLGLFPLRRLPMTDREDEQGRLWAALGEVESSREPRAFLLEGGLGVGRSRLAGAVAERAVELGLAVAVHAIHGRVAGPGDGLVPALRNHLRLFGLAAVDQDQRLHALLGPEAVAAGPVLRGEAPEGVDARDRITREQHVLRGLLARLAGDHLVVVVVDDAEWGPSDVEFVRAAVTAPRPGLPVLFLVCTGSADATPELEALAAVQGVARLPVEPLPAALVEGLLHDVLAFAPAAATEVTRRSAGNPLLALQLVRAWADRGHLRLGSDGFEPVPGAPMVGEVREVWEAALQRVVDEVDGAGAVEVAGALGVEVEGDLWEAATRALGHVVPAGLVEALLRAGLVEATAGGWRFAHPVIHELVETRLDPTRAITFHRHLAEVLRARPAVEPARVARHLLAAGEADGAADLLLDAMGRAVDAFAFGRAMEMVDLLRQALAQAPHEDPRHVNAALLAVRAQLGTGRLEEAERAAARLAETARSRKLPGLRARALRYRAMALEKRGALQIAEAVFSQAETLSEIAGDDENLAACLEHSGTLLRQQGDLAGSRERLEQALAIYRRGSERRLVADCLKELGGTLVRAGEGAEAMTALAEAAAHYEAIGSAAGAAETLNNLAEVERAEGHLDEAAAHYEAAFAALKAAGHHASPIPLLNLGLVRLARREWAQATATLERALSGARESGKRVIELYARTFLLPCRAAVRDWEGFDVEFEAAERLTEETGLVDAEVADALGLAADLAVGHPGRVARARALEARHRGAGGG